MYSVTKRIDFCYGHRLLDYDGVCKHPHGHNALVEVDVRTDRRVGITGGVVVAVVIAMNCSL